MRLFNPFKRIAELEARIARLEQSTTDRFAVVMASATKHHGQHRESMKRIQRLDAEVLSLKEQTK